MSGVEQQVTSLSGQCHHHGENLRELTTLLQKLQARVDQMDDGAAGPSASVRDAVGQPLREVSAAGLHGDTSALLGAVFSLFGRQRGWERCCCDKGLPFLFLVVESSVPEKEWVSHRLLLTRQRGFHSTRGGGGQETCDNPKREVWRSWRTVAFPVLFSRLPSW